MVAHKSASQKRRCTAIDRYGEKCTQDKAEGDERWCHNHGIEQSKLYKDYKRCTKELEDFPEVDAVKDSRVILACESLETLQEWHRNARRRYNLVTRAIDARTYHHEHFFSMDVDWGHAKFILNLKKEKKATDYAMYHMNSRAHELCLGKDVSASLREQESRIPKPSDDNECSVNEQHGGQSPTATAASKKNRHAHAHKHRHDTYDADDDDPDNPLEAAYNERRSELQRLVSVCAHYACDYDDPVIGSERHLIYDAVIRSVIAGDPALTLVALRYDTIHAFLCHCEELDIADLTRLSKALALFRHDNKSLAMRETRFREAVQNTLFRKPEGTPEVERSWLLGGWVYKYPLGADMPRRGWDHMYAFVRCKTCVLSCTYSLAELLRNRQYALAPYDVPRYLTWADHDQTHTGHGLRALGVLVGEVNKTVIHSVYKQEDARSVGEKEVWTEKQDRAWIYIRVHRDAPWADLFFRLLAALSWDTGPRPSLDLIVRDGRHYSQCGTTDSPPTSIIYQSPSLWATRYRSAVSKLGLQKAEWEVDSVFDETSFVYAKSPEHKWSLDFIGDAYDAYILDAGLKPGELSVSNLKTMVLYVCQQAHQVGSYEDVLSSLAQEAECEDREWRASVDASAIDMSWKCVRPDNPRDTPANRESGAKWWEKHSFHGDKDGLIICGTTEGLIRRVGRT